VNVALCAPYGPDRVSGVSVFLQGLEAGLKARGHVVHILTPDRAPWLVRMPRGWQDLSLSIWTASRILRSGGTLRVVHANQPHPQSLAALISAMILGIRFVVTYHSEMPPAGHRASGWAQGLSHWVLRQHADATAFVSEATKAAFPGTEGAVVRIGVPRDEAAAARRSPKRSDPTFTFLFVGRQTRSKGFFDVLAAVGRLRSRPVPRPFRLVLTGDVPEEEAREKEKILKAARDVVEDRGILRDRGELLRTIAGSDALLLPSYREGLPLVVLEAMALGCAPIVSTVGGLPEVVREGETGLLVTPGDVDGLVEKMRWALAHPVELAVLGERAAAFVQEHLDFTNTVDAYVALYEGGSPTDPK